MQVVQATSFAHQVFYRNAATSVHAEMSTRERRNWQRNALRALGVGDIVQVQTLALLHPDFNNLKHSNVAFRVIDIRDSFGDTKQYFIESIDNPDHRTNAVANQTDDLEFGLLYRVGKMSLVDHVRLGMR